MRLCLIFGIPSVEEAQRRIPDAQFWEWMALDQIDPLPDPWHMHARLCAQIDTVATGKPRKLQDYLPQPEKKQSKLGSVQDHRRQNAAQAMRKRRQ